jgi:hypothetical protein
MITNIIRKDGRFKYLDVSFEEISELDHLDYMFEVLEQHIDIEKAPNYFEEFYTNFFKVCQQALKE